jgi:hypothetical protein
VNASWRVSESFIVIFALGGNDGEHLFPPEF